MSYPQHGNILGFFRPIMAVAANDTKPLCDIDVGASSGDHGEFICHRPCTVKQLLFAVTLEAISGTSAAPTVVFTKQIIAGSASGGSAMGTLTLPTGTAIGKTVYKQITPVDFKVGDVIHIAWTIGTGTPTGQGNADVYAEYKPEVAGNQSDMIASA